MYQAFNPFIIRTPHFSFKELKEIPFKTLIQNPIFKEAIYIASPILHDELQKLHDNKIINLKDRNRIEAALYRYLSRMSTRCTPFGLFAGLSVGMISDDTKIILGDYKQHTRLDMQFLCNLSEKISELSIIKENIKYYPNTSIYKLGRFYRYIEYKKTASGTKNQIVSVECSAYLNTILKLAKNGVIIKDLLIFLKSKLIDYEFAIEYINELISSQILVNSISPTVTDCNYYEKIINTLKDLNVSDNVLNVLNDIQYNLHQLNSISSDNNYQQHMLSYDAIIQDIKKIKIPFETNAIFQVDMTRSSEISTLGKDIIDQLKSTLIFLIKIKRNNQKEEIELFKKMFYDRYEERELPLMEVLDPEMGIGYPVGSSTGKISPLLDEYNIHNVENKKNDYYYFDEFSSLLLNRTMDAINMNSIEIELNDNDVNNFTNLFDELPLTLFSMFNILKVKKNSSTIYLHGFYGVSGAKTLTRFAHTDSSINEFVNEIVAKENELYPDAILAEIVHLPEPKIGNVVVHPHIRDYEIPYLSQTDLPESNIINVSDILISIKSGEIILRSKKLNKKIIPRLTNAHNYSDYATAPAYKFLSEIQHQGNCSSVFFDWGYLNNELNFRPRVKYKKTILSLATWKVEVKELKPFFDMTDALLTVEINRWRIVKHLPQRVLLSDFDNELLIDWGNLISIKSLFAIIKNRNTINIKEYLLEEDTHIVNDKIGNPYINECIVAFYKSKKK